MFCANLGQIAVLEIVKNVPQMGRFLGFGGKSLGAIREWDPKILWARRCATADGENLDQSTREVGDFWGSPKKFGGP